ncbi:MAG: hypothetical protein AAFN11_05180, partial [Chloroflexota bacterium]
LGGEEISEAEAWLQAADSGNKNPPPTNMHRTYIEKSRAAEDDRLRNLRRLESRTRQFRTAAAILGVAIIGAIIAVVFAVNESQRAQNNSATAVAVADVAEQNAADANATLTPIQSTLTRAADDIVLANEQVADANATLQPIPPTLTQAAGEINTANESLALAETQVADANATLQPIPPTLTQSAEDIALAADAVSTAQIQIENAESELTSIPPTLEALDSQIAEAEERVEALNLASQALSLGNAATERLNENSIELAALLAIRSLRIDYNTAADTALIRASSRLYTDTLITADAFPLSTAFHADENLIVVGMDDGAVFFYDADTGEVRAINDSEHDVSVSTVGFVPDTMMLITGDEDGRVVFWDAEDADPQETIEVDAGVLSMDFDEDVERLAIGLNNGDVCIIDLDEEDITFCFPTDEESVPSVAFGPNDMLVSAYFDGAAIWDLGSDDAEFVDEYFLHDRGVNAVDVTADGEHILTASSDTKIILWEAETGDIIRVFDDNMSDVTHARFTADEQFIYSASWDGVPRLWNVETGEVVRAFGGHTSIILSMGISEGADQFVTSAEDGTVRLWDANSEFSRGVYLGHDDWVTNLAFSDDGQYLVSSGDQSLRVWDLLAQTQTSFFDAEYEAEGVAFVPNSTQILFDFEDNLAIWDFDNDDLVADEVELPAYAVQLRVTSDGEYFVYQSFPSTEEGDPIYMGFGEFGDDNLEVFVDTEEDSITGFDVALDENIVVWIENFETIVMYDIDEQDVVNRLGLDTPEDLWWVAITPDATLLMLGTQTGTTLFVDTNTGDILATIEDAHSAPTRSMRISPDGQWGVSTSEDQSVILWNLTTLSQERVYTNHSGWVLDAVFSPDSSLVASSGADETVQVWTVSVEDLIADVCSQLARDLTPQERLRFSIMDDAPTCQ